ncbi:hypothetical protein CU098_005884, partial [Rhizopus stolonifer]
MVRLSTSLTFIFSCILLCMVRSSDAACKQMGQSCDQKIECCDGYHCNLSRHRCEMNTFLNSHDRFCINMFGSTPGCDPKGVGSPLGYCDCYCHEFNPDPFCTSLDIKLKYNHYETESDRKKDELYFDQRCKKQIEKQDAACSRCDF